MACRGEQACISDCSRVFDEALEKCPCHDGCPNGCPCPDYECPVVDKFTNSSVLILDTSTYGTARLTPVITDLNANVDTETIFKIEDDTDVFFSCGVKFKGYFYIFGGLNESRRKISRIEGCSLS